MRHCTHCGSVINDNARFCRSCGRTVERPEIPEGVPVGNSAIRAGNTPAPTPPKKPGKFLQIVKVVVYLVLFVQAQVVVTVALSAFYALAHNIGAENLLGVLEYALGNTVLLSLISNLLFIGIVIAAALILRNKVSDSLGMRRFPLRLIPAFALFGASINVLLSFLMALIPWPAEFIESQSESYSYVSAAPLLLAILSVSLVTGLTEEILFRGIIISRLRRSFSRTFAIAVSCIVFSVFHVTPVAMTYTFIFAVFLGVFYNKYNSVWPPVICHAAFNLTAIGLEYLADDVVLILAVLLASAAMFILSLYLILRKGNAVINTTETQDAAA